MLNYINSWRLTHKIPAAFLLLALLTAGLAINGIWSNAIQTKATSNIVTRDVQSLAVLVDLAFDVKEQRILSYSYYASKSAEDAAKVEKRAKEAEQRIVKHIAAYRALVDDDMKPEADKLTGLIDRFNEANAKMFALRKAGDMEASYTELKGSGRETSYPAWDQVSRLLKLSRERADHRYATARAEVQLAFYWALFFSIASLIGLLAIWFAMDRTVTRPLGALTRNTTILAEGGVADVPHLDRTDELGDIAQAVERFRVAGVERAQADADRHRELEIVTTALDENLTALRNGDLTAEIQADFPTALASIKSNFNDALVSLRSLIGGVVESAGGIRTGSREIAQASEDLARRTEANAATLEQTSAAIAQMDNRVRTNAKAATDTVKRADGAITSVEGGRTIANAAMEAMNRVADSAKGIDSVIEGLDKIAFQTRVLAMNAAVEAGRAGEAGKGFAVVADLVSALAMRSEEEAKRAREQLTATQTDIIAAVDMVDKVDTAFSDISGNVGEVHALLSQMAEDNQAQATAISEITSAVNAMDQSTQQNAAMVEETSAAARNLSVEVGALAENAERFKISNGHPFPGRSMGSQRAGLPLH